MKRIPLSVTLLLAAALLLLQPLSAALDPQEEAILAAPEPPAVPTGFTDEKQLMLAAAGGLLTLLDLDAEIPVPDSVEMIPDVEYGRVGDRPLLLDVYLPKNLDKPVPGLMFIHGGGWKNGGKKDYKYYCVRFAARGYVVVSISYRLIGEAVFPACVQDAKCAVRWMRANADKYKIDPDRIAAIGGSAGGHLSMMLGYSAGVPELEGNGGHAEFSSAVNAVVDLYGPVDITLPEHRGNPTVLGFFGGKTYDEIPDQYKLASPWFHLDPKDPPTLILHGTIDTIVPVSQSDILNAKLKELGVPVTYDRLDGYPHTMDIAKEVNLRCQWFMLRFLEEHFKMKAGK